MAAENDKELVLSKNLVPAPQYWNPSSQKYEVVKGSDGASNIQVVGPLPIGGNKIGKVDAELLGSSVVIPVDIQGISLVNAGESLPVTVVNQPAATVTKPVEIIDIVSAASLRDTTEVQVDMPDLSKYVKYDFYVINGLDQVVRIAPWRHTAITLSDETIGRWSTAVDNTDGLSYSFRVPAKPTIGSGAYWLSEIIPTSGNTSSGTPLLPKLVNWFSRVNNTGTTGLLKLVYKTAVAPTSGTLTIRFVGYVK